MTGNLYIKRMQSQVDQWTSEISRLKKIMLQMSADARRTYEVKIQELQEQREKMLRRIDTMQSTMALQ